MAKPVVAVLKTEPETVLEDYARLMRMAVPPRSMGHAFARGDARP